MPQTLYAPRSSQMWSRRPRIVPSRRGGPRGAWGWGVAGGQADGVDLVAGMRRAHHVLAAVLHPLHRSAEDDRGDRHQVILRIPRGLGAEAAAEIGRDDAHLVVGKPEGGGQALLDEMRH